MNKKYKVGEKHRLQVLDNAMDVFLMQNNICEIQPVLQVVSLNKSAFGLKNSVFITGSKSVAGLR